jgi:putative membrane protein
VPSWTPKPWQTRSSTNQSFRVAVGRVASWWRRTVTFEPDRIVVDEGILQRTQRVVPYERIQQVDLRSDIRHRVLGAASVRIDVAGGAGQGVRLDVLPEPLARSLQAFVVARRDDELAAEGVETPAESARGDVLLELSTRRLLVAGLMSDAVGVAFAGAAGLVGFVWQLGVVTPQDVADQATETHVVIAAAALLVLTPIAAALAGVYRYGRYRLTAEGDRLHLAHGLIETRRITVPRRRVQVVTVRENIVGRRLGLVSLAVASATTAGDRSAPTVLRVPILPRAELDDFLERLMDDPAWRPPRLYPRPHAALRRAVVRRTVPLLAVIGAAVFLTPWSVLLTLPAILLGVVWGRAAHRRAGHATTDHLSALAAGVVLHRLHLVPHARLQSARASASPLQRRAALATIHLDVAGRKDAPHLLDVDGPTARRMALALPRQEVHV